MDRLSRWAVLNPKLGILSWFAMTLVVGILSANFGGTYNNSFNLPNTESTKAQEVLGKMEGVGDSINAVTVKVVWKSEAAPATDPVVAGPITGLLTELSEISSIACVSSPYGAGIGNACPPVDPNAGAGFDPSSVPPEVLKVLVGLGPAGVSMDQQVGYATVTFAGSTDDIPLDDTVVLLDAIEAASADSGLIIGASGQILDLAGQEPPSSEAIGVTVALIILMFAFGSLVGAFLPIISALLALFVGHALVVLTANALEVATFAPTLAAMIGLGVGIDYALFVINRFKEDLDNGIEPRAAVLESVRTAGRAVRFAALTVIIGLLGLFVVGIDFFNGLAVASAVTVVMMMFGATFLLPALLSLLGPKAFALKLPWKRNSAPIDIDKRLFSRYGLWLEKNFKWVGALALVVLLVIATPIASLRLGFSDDSGKAEGKPARIAYDLVSEGFGQGINGPFLIAMEFETAGDNAGVQTLAGAINQADGVAAAIAFPVAPDAMVGVMQVIPDSAPQDQATTDLLNSLRDEVVPAATEGTGITAYVGGAQAITSDFTSVMVDALPLFVLVVVGLGFLTLILLFRSILIPLIGAITSLISMAAAMGVVVAVFQWGWLAELVGIQTTGPIFPFLPIMVFAILFGLSMDYQVFLVSAMQERWEQSGDNEQAVRRGLGVSGRVVAIAAAIMFSVFSAFILGNDPTIKLFGIALSSAVLFDAFIVRLIIVPSLMFNLGNKNWWAPAWLNRVLPKVSH